MNYEDSKSKPITLEQEGNLVSGKQAADIFITQYSETSDLQVPRCREKEVKESQQPPISGHERGIMNAPFTTAELEEALSVLKMKKAPGPDNVTNEMLVHLGPKSKKKLLQIFNDGWKAGSVPQIWREAVMIPVHKKGKDRAKAESYRPISLTSCVGKLMERIINKRLVHHIEEKQLIPPEQAAFRQNRSTEDQITYISQAIEDAFQEKKHTIAVWIDLEKAFDKVWKEGLKLKMRQVGVGGRMYKWIGQYMHNRKARAQVNQQYSRKKTLRQGVPQGGVLPPTLFLIFLHDIIEKLPKNVKGAIYADDLALWCSEEYQSTAQYRLQEALKEIEKWTNSWMIKINGKKTTFTVFTLSNPTKRNQTKTRQSKEITLKINGEKLKEEEQPTYLGVTFDRRLTWNSQIQRSHTRAKIRLGLMKKLASTQWGANKDVLKKLYVGRVRPVLEYGTTALSTAAKTNKEKLNKIQNQAMRMMTGAMKSTPIQALETATGLSSLDDRRDTKVLICLLYTSPSPRDRLLSRMPSSA